MTILGRLLQFLLRPVLELDHRKVRLSAGQLELEDVQICAAAMSEAWASLGLQFVHGRVARVRVALCRDAWVELVGLVLVVQPNQKPAASRQPRRAQLPSQPQPLGVNALAAMVRRTLGRMPISLRGLTVRLLDAQCCATAPEGTTSQCVDLCVQWLRIEGEGTSGRSSPLPTVKLVHFASIALVVHPRPPPVISTAEPAS